MGGIYGLMFFLPARPILLREIGRTQNNVLWYTWGGIQYS